MNFIVLAPEAALRQKKVSVANVSLKYDLSQKTKRAKKYRSKSVPKC